MFLDFSKYVVDFFNIQFVTNFFHHYKYLDSTHFLGATF